MGNSLGCGKAAANDGSVLDRVISQASNEDDCLLYRLANYKNGGELIDAYNVGGQIEVEKLIREQFGVLMYADGKGQVIKRAEYLRWKFRDLKQVVLPIEASLSTHDPLGKWEDHEACWQMQYRGSLGETLLHVLIICDTKLHTRLARTLIKCFPKLAMDVVEGEDYLGASGLHLAIAYANNELVQDLVEAGANVMQRAIGSFFLPRDQQLAKPKRHTDYEGLAYLGEFPLAWAACCANESVYNLLCESGANPDAQDSFGNMILHMVVVSDNLDMFGYALRHPRLPAKNGILNQDGLTPLTLACKLGRAEVFREMLELSCREFWRYSNITCSAYPLNALDTLLPDGRTNWNSALFIILNGTKEEHLDMLDGGIIQRLLEEKWKTFAQQQFLKRLAILFLHLLTLSMAVYLRPERSEDVNEEWDAQAIMRAGFEVGTLANILSYLVLQQGGEIKNQGLSSFLKQLGNAPAKAIFLVSNVMILLCIPFRINGDRNTEEAILLFAVPGSWFLLMFFAGAVRLTGPFVTMVYSMITGDMLTFGIIYTVVLFGFSQSFYFLYKGFPGVKSSQYSSYPSTWMALFQITLGDYNYPDLSNTTYPSLSKTVFAIFMVLVPILLLNMLIAMMGNTYAHVIEQSEKEWMKQWAKIVVTLERAVNQTDAHHYLQEYSMSLGPSDDPAQEQRGVLVIKSKSKTRAKQRKGAVCNWKKVGKVTINALRKRGMTGEQLNRIMWGRASISTPVKKKRKGYDVGGLGGLGGVGDLSALVADPFATDTAFMNSMNMANSADGGFGLNSALDIMAFSNDMGVPDINKNGLGQPQCLVLNNGALPAQGMPAATTPLGTMAAPGAVTTTSALGAPKPGVVMNGVPPQMNPVPARPAVGPVQLAAPGTKPTPAAQVPMAVPVVVPVAGPMAVPVAGPMAVPMAGPMAVPSLGTVTTADDPLRELVLVADEPRSSPEQLAALAALARKAADMDQPDDPLSMAAARMPGLGAFAAGLGLPVGGLGPQQQGRKHSVTLEPSDSDDFGEGPLLGRVARLRRARSAVSRPDVDLGGVGGLRLDDGYSSSTASSFDAGMLSPTMAMAGAQPPPPPSAVEATVAAQPRPKAQVVQPPPQHRPPPQPAPQAPPQPQPKAESSAPSQPEGTSNGKKYSRHKHRPKTAKPNRVAPTPEAPPRRGVSAGPTSTNNSKLSSGSGSNDSGSQDPLEPWSVRGIEPMNALLAWDQEEQNSL